jgi:putative hydrolase of the HAD superfamily
VIKAIIFDCFGVLTADNWHAFTESLPEGIKQKARDLNHQYDSGELTYDEFVNSVRNVTGRPKSEIQQSLQTGTAKNLGLLSYIQELRKHGHKIGLISNVAHDWIRQEFLTAKEQQLFDAMTMSYEEGVTKPHPNMYQTTLKKLDVKPQEAIFIDDIQRYCEAARGMGMQAVVYQNFEQMKTELEELLANTEN